MIDFLNKPTIRVISSSVTFVVLMTGVVWISSGVFE